MILLSSHTSPEVLIYGRLPTFKQPLVEEKSIFLCISRWFLLSLLPLWVIGKECGFYQEMASLLISCYDGKKYACFIIALCMQYIYQTKGFTLNRSDVIAYLRAVGLLVIWKLCAHFSSNIICRHRMSRQSNALPLILIPLQHVFLRSLFWRSKQINREEAVVWMKGNAAKFLMNEPHFGL